jgi:hypothetical protein
VREHRFMEILMLLVLAVGIWKFGRAVWDVIADIF